MILWVYNVPSSSFFFFFPYTWSGDPDLSGLLWRNGILYLGSSSPSLKTFFSKGSICFSRFTWKKGQINVQILILQLQHQLEIGNQCKTVNLNYKWARVDSKTGEKQFQLHFTWHHTPKNHSGLAEGIPLVDSLSPVHHERRSPGGQDGKGGGKTRRGQKRD